jgi:hypothetical protein
MHLSPSVISFSWRDARMPGRFPPGTVIHYDAQAMHSAQAPQDVETFHAERKRHLFFFWRGFWGKNNYQLINYRQKLQRTER